MTTEKRSMRPDDGPTDCVAAFLALVFGLLSLAAVVVWGAFLLRWAWP